MFQIAAVEATVILQLLPLQNDSYIPCRMDGVRKIELQSCEFCAQHKNLSLHKLKITYLVCIMINKSTVGVKCLPKDDEFGHVSLCCASCADCKGYSPWPAPVLVISPPLEINTCLSCWHSHSQEYSSTYSAEIAALREWSTGSYPGQLRLNTAWIPEVPDTWSIAVQAGAACEQLDGDFSISGSWRGSVIIGRTQNPISSSDVTKCHRFVPIDTAPYRQAPNLLWACVFWKSLRDWSAEHCRSGRFFIYVSFLKKKTLKMYERWNERSQYVLQ